MEKPYSDFSFAIDLIMFEHNITNPILISEKIKEDLDMDISIHQISDYLSVDYRELEKINRPQYYNINY